MKKITAFVISHEPDSSRTAKDYATNIIALMLTRALGRESVRVVRVHPNPFEDSLSSRYCHATEICPDMYQSEVAHTEFLVGLAKQYPGTNVLIPASDDCSLYLAKAADILSKSFVLLNPSVEAMENIKDKRRQYEFAAALGVPIPETYFPESVAEIEEVAEKLQHYPYVIKPLNAQLWRLQKHAKIAGGQKAITVFSRDELVSEFNRIFTADNQVMVQEIIEGDDKNLITFLGYCSKEHKPFAHCIRSKLRQAPVDFGYCTATVSCHNDSVEKFAKLLLINSGYTGIVGIEFKLDPATNEYKLIEINTRAVNTTGISIGCGVNLPVIAFNDAIGIKQDPVIDWEDGVVWLRLSQDIAAALELRRRGRLTMVEWFRSIRGKRVHAIYASDDLTPFFRYYFRFVRHQIGKRVRGGTKVDRASGDKRSWLRKATNWMF